jgi:hypothetical protein
MTLLKRLTATANYVETLPGVHPQRVAEIREAAALIRELVEAGNVLCENLWFGDEVSRKTARIATQRWVAVRAKVSQP